MLSPRFARLSLAAASSLAEKTAAPLAEAVHRLGAEADELLFVARVHGVAGLLARLDEKDGALRSPLARALGAERERIAERTSALTSDLAAIGQAAASAGLDLVPLKGAVLGALRYGDPSLRPAADIDLLCREEELARWERVLTGLGYALTARSGKDLVFRRPGERVPTGFEERPDNPRPVELHFRIPSRLLGRTVDPTEAYRARLAAGELPSVGRALLPDDDALLLHLLAHLGPAAVGRGARLIQLHDLSLLAPTASAGALRVAHRGAAAWGLAALCARSLPGALPGALLVSLQRARPPRRRADAWLRRPGLQTGAEERTLLALAELPLCRSLGERAARLLDALPERSLLTRTYGGDELGLRGLLRYAADRLRR